MPAAPKKKTRQLSRSQVRYKVIMGNRVGSAPSDLHPADFLKPVQIQFCASGQRVNTITFDVDLGENQDHIQDIVCPKGINRQVEIQELDVFGQFKRVIAWGKFAVPASVSISETESVQVIARIDKHLFGSALGRIPFWFHFTGGNVRELDRPIVFNPEVDEVILGNRSDKQWSARNDCYVFFDADSVDTTAARTMHTQTPAKWKIYQAVHTLCWLLNSSEEFIKNPTLADCFIDLSSLDSVHDILRNLSISLTTSVYLPQALDALLTPFGATWCVDSLRDKNGVTIRKLRFFKRNTGTKRELFLQRPGSILDPAKSFVPQFSSSYDISNLANKIIGCTSRKQREGTFLLYHCWLESEDTLDRDALDTALAKAHPHAYRKFVLNESGAWTGIRTGVTLTNLAGHFDLDNTLPTARRFLPCLSRVSNADSNQLESRGIYCEWLNPDTATWERFKWAHSNLEQECGIFFDEIPQKLYDAIYADPTTQRIRVTATIEGDQKTYSTATPTLASPNGDDIELRLELGDKFHDKDVTSTSIFYADRATADVSNDTVPLAGYVAHVAGVEDSAELSTSAILEGIDHPEYQIGDLITKVNGRNLKLNRNNAKPGNPEKYLQIMGITYNLPSGEDSKPQTELLLESFDEERF